MWNKLIPSKDSPKISFFNQLEVQDLRYLHQVTVWRRLLWCPRVELLEYSSSQSEHLWSKEKSYVLPAHTLNIQWQDKHRVTTLNHPHPIQKRGKLKTQRSLQPIVKPIRANVESSLTKTQGLKMSLQLSASASELLVILSFLWKATLVFCWIVFLACFLPTEALWSKGRLSFYIDFAPSNSNMWYFCLFNSLKNFMDLL